MKILQVIGDLDPHAGGTVSAIKGLSEALVSRGHEVTVACVNSINKVSVDGVRLVMEPCDWRAWRYSKTLGKKLNALVNEAEVVHLHGLWEYPLWRAAVSCRKNNKPTVLTTHGMLDQDSLRGKGLKKSLYRFLIGDSVLKSATRLHFTSDDEKKGSGDDARGRVVPLGLPVAAFDRAETGKFKSFLNLSSQTRLLLFLARLHPQKEPERLLQAFSLLKQPEARLIMVGPGELAYVKSLRKTAERLGIGGTTVFTGLLTSSQVRDAYRDAELFVLPSRKENFGLAAVEAMAAGCPVVVSPFVGLAKTIERAGAGWVSDTSPDLLARQLEICLNDAAAIKRTGENARRLAQECFSWDKNILLFEELYREIL